LTNIMQVPSLVKIIISRGVGAAVSDKKTSWACCW
jgi:ribosomal protein L5